MLDTVTGQSVGNWGNFPAHLACAYLITFKQNLWRGMGKTFVVLQEMEDLGLYIFSRSIC